MKQLLLFPFLIAALSVSSQSVMQSVNSASIIGASSSISVGEIVVVPVNQSQSSSGIIGILAQVNQQTLEVPELVINDKIVVFPNPTMSSITFQTDLNIINEKVTIVSVSGQVVAKKQISESNSLDVSELQTGIYMIQFENININSFKIIKR